MIAQISRDEYLKNAISIQTPESDLNSVYRKTGITIGLGAIELLSDSKFNRGLRSIGIQPDIIICRSEQTIPNDQRKKISLFCNVPIDNVIETVDVKTIYEAPISFHKEKFDERVLSYRKHL